MHALHFIPLNNELENSATSVSISWRDGTTTSVPQNCAVRLPSCMVDLRYPRSCFPHLRYEAGPRRHRQGIEVSCRFVSYRRYLYRRRSRCGSCPTTQLAKAWLLCKGESAAPGGGEVATSLSRELLYSSSFSPMLAVRDLQSDFVKPHRIHIAKPQIASSLGAFLPAAQ